MTTAERGASMRIPLSYSQRNLYRGVLHDGDPTLYLIGKSYHFHPIEHHRFLSALRASIAANPVQLCVLEARAASEFPETPAASEFPGGYPDLVPRLQADDLIRVCASDAPPCRQRVDPSGNSDSPSGLAVALADGIHGTPLVRYTVHLGAEDSRDGLRYVVALEVHAHHLLLDGGATALIEADLARYLELGPEAESPCTAAGLVAVADAHRCEARKVEGALERLTAVVSREIATGQASGGAVSRDPGGAVRGILTGSIEIRGGDYDAILALAERVHIPLDALVTAAAVAVDARRRATTETLVIHAVDNRFGEPELLAATCLVNSVAHPVRFPAFASVAELARLVDRGYVTASRRRWLREERYRQMYMAINRTSGVDAVTLNFIREPCAPALRPFLTQAPTATDIGPVETPTVACVHDEQQRTLAIAIWNRSDDAAPGCDVPVAEQIATALVRMPHYWQHPVAMIVDDWLALDSDARVHPSSTLPAAEGGLPTWFHGAVGGIAGILDRHPGVRTWMDLLVRQSVIPGDVVVFADDGTATVLDLVMAVHLAGCGYSACDRPEQVAERCATITDTCPAATVHAIDVAEPPRAAARTEGADGRADGVDERIATVLADPEIDSRIAYLMPTSGSTGEPKLVEIRHDSLAAFSAAAQDAYGWGPGDTVLQCAPLTSDISVEEIFVAARCGARLIRSAATRSGDLIGLAATIRDAEVTVVDLPTALWHLLCDDDAALSMVNHSRLRQIVVGGELIHPSAVTAWFASGAASGITIVSSYGPTEGTVVATVLPITAPAVRGVDPGWTRLGNPLLAGTVFIAFGEVLIVGITVAAGYLGSDGPCFGTITADGHRPLPVLATGDRVRVDDSGFPVFAGRRDAFVKISGIRVDTAEVTARLAGNPAVIDVAVENRSGRLGIWFRTAETRAGNQDQATETWIRRTAAELGIPSFFVAGVPVIPRKAGGKVDSDELPMPATIVDPRGGSGRALDLAARLAELWIQRLGRPMGPDTSLLEEGIGSLDLISIMPPTRALLGRQLTILDLISADTATNLAVDSGAVRSGWLDDATAAVLDDDCAAARRKTAVTTGPAARRHGSGPILVLGASGIVGTGFARAAAARSFAGSELILAMRSTPPEHDPWPSLAEVDGVRIERIVAEAGIDVDALLRDTGAAAVINCIGDANFVAPYQVLRTPNVVFVSELVGACARQGAALVHLSSFVVNGDPADARVVTPQAALYPYAASKVVAELIVAAAPDELDFSVVRLPRVLGDVRQIRASADILAALVDACAALDAYPRVSLCEEVTTGWAVAEAILGRIAGPQSWRGGRELAVLRGENVAYQKILAAYGHQECDPVEWKNLLDRSDWARSNPRRWAVIDGWISLGQALGGRSFAERLGEDPGMPLDVTTVTELAANPESIAALLESALPEAASRRC